jgi:hypothetical protein
LGYATKSGKSEKGYIGKFVQNLVETDVFAPKNLVETAILTK